MDPLTGRRHARTGEVGSILPRGAAIAVGRHLAGSLRGPLTVGHRLGVESPLRLQLLAPPGFGPVAPGVGGIALLLNLGDPALGRGALPCASLTRLLLRNPKLLGAESLGPETMLYRRGAALLDQPADRSHALDVNLYLCHLTHPFVPRAACSR